MDRPIEESNIQLTQGDGDIDLEWEEWDGKSPFLHHCIAGSIAGVAEHTLLYPVDTVKTHMQAFCATCPNNPANQGKAGSKAICTGPPSKAVQSSSPGAAVSSSLSRHISASSSKKSSSSAQVPHGMLSTMRNLIQHGHSTSPVAMGPSSLTEPTMHGKRQSGTLSIPSNKTTTHTTASTNTSTVANSAKGGVSRLWRGVQTMAVGCVPAHALYFSAYEYCKSTFSTTIIDSSGNTQSHLAPVGASIAGAASTFSHDIIMTPLDTIKQRMQLGHYTGMGHAFGEIVKLEGWGSLYRSFGVTLLTNVPYGMVMMSVNEFLREIILDCKRERRQVSNYTNGDKAGADIQTLDLSTTLLAGCGAGFAASAFTAPLDRVKTRLQTQRLGTVTVPEGCPKAAAALAKELQLTKPKYSGLTDAFVSIVKEEGMIGLWRGVVPRVLTHAPAVAISWTSYEAAKKWLASIDL